MVQVNTFKAIQGYSTFIYNYIWPSAKSSDIVGEDHAFILIIEFSTKNTGGWYSLRMSQAFSSVNKIYTVLLLKCP